MAKTKSSPVVEDVITVVTGAVFGGAKRQKTAPLVPPGLTSTTTPGGIAANDPEALPAQKRRPDEGEPITLPLASLCRHPDNRVPDEESIRQRGASLIAHGQLDEVIVRRIAAGKYEILSGETRVLAAQRIGWTHVRCRIRDCDDAQALVLLAEYNAQRTDLNPIEKARLIKRLCDPEDKGGAGLTREAAAKMYGFESHAAASQLVRLLELPKIWQERVASGEFPQSFARMLVPYAHAPRLMAAIDKEYREAMEGEDYERERWESRAALEETLDQVFHEHTRPIEKNDAEYFDKGFGKDPWRYSGKRPLMFQLTPEIETTLDIHEFEVKEYVRGKEVTKTRRRATNCEAYDKLQIPAIKRFVDSKGKAQAAAAGEQAERAAAKQPLTKAEEKAKAKKQAEQLAARVQVWRHKLLRHMLINHLDDGDESGFRVFLAVACHRPTSVSLAEMLAQACSQTKRKHRFGEDLITWSDFEAIENGRKDGFDEVFVVVEIAKRLLAHEASNPKYPTLPFKFIESYAAACKFTLAECWEWIQLQQPKSPLFEEFFLLHSSAQLDALAQEWGVYLPGSQKRDAKVRLLAGHSLLPLPKSLVPLPGEGAPKAPAKKRGRK